MANAEDALENDWAHAALPGESRARATQQLTRSITLCGRGYAVCLLAYSILSYGLAPIRVLRVSTGPVKSFDDLAQQLSFLGQTVQNFVSGQSVLAHPFIFLLAYGVPTALCTGIFVLLLSLLAHRQQHLDQSIPILLWRWAVVFAVITIFASPVLVQDFWLSLGWGAMVAGGQNPYYTAVPREIWQHLPCEDGIDKMTYGPLWALMSGLIMWVMQGHFWLAALVFKCLLAAAWLGTLRCIWGLLGPYSLWHQCLGLTIFGWLPLSVMQAVADGHNDIVMVLFLLLWLYQLEQGKHIMPRVYLAASVLIKYVTAPLFLLDVLHFVYTRQQRLWAYKTLLLMTTTCSGLVLALFYRSTDFFAPATTMRQWRFLRPSDAIYALEHLGNLHGHVFSKATLVAFPLLALYCLYRYWHQPGSRSFRIAVLAVLCGVLFSGVGHVWPWFLLWILGVAATVPESAWTRWGLGVALVFPVPLVLWGTFPQMTAFARYFALALGCYTVACLWFVCVPRSWFPPARQS